MCVTRQTSCERLIRTGCQFVQEEGGSLSVVHVAPRGANFLGGDSDGDALDYLYDIAKRSDADMTVLRSDDVTRTLVKHARDKRITHIILGVSATMLQAPMSENIAAELQRQLKNTQVITVPA